MQRSVECPVCTEVYNTTTKLPKSLSCGHGFCVPCLDTLLIGPGINCPKCRTKCNVPSGKITELPTNFSVIDMLGALCEECTDRPHTGRCDHCSQNLCESCKKPHEEVVLSEIPDLMAVEKLVTEISDKYTGTEELQMLITYSEKIINQVAVVRQELITKVEKWHNDLVSEIKTKIHSFTEQHFEWQEKLGRALVNGRIFINKSKLSLTNISPREQNEREGDSMQSMKKQSIAERDSLLAWMKLKPLPPELKFECKMKEFDTTLAQFAEVACEKFPDYKAVIHKSTYRSDNMNPWGTCQNSDTGNILVANIRDIFEDDCEVLVFNEDLQLLSTLYIRECDVFGIAAIDENIYLTDYSRHRIKVVDKNGTLLYTFGSQGSGEEMYSHPRGTAFNSLGLLFVCDSENHRVKVATKYGKFVREFGQNVFGSEEPRHVSVSPDNKIAATDNSGNLYLFTSDGDHIKTIKGKIPPDNIDYTDVAFDKTGNIVAADYNGRLVATTEQGEVISFFGTGEEEPGSLKHPEGVVVTKSGNIVVCDEGNNRIQMFSVPYTEVLSNLNQKP